MLLIYYKCLGGFDISGSIILSFLFFCYRLAVSDRVGWWLVVGGWWLLVVGWWLLVGGCWVGILWLFGQQITNNK